MRFQAETKDVILQRMVNKVVARSELTDLVSTSQLLQVLAASARAIEKVQQGMEDILDDRDINKVTGTDLDDWAKVILPYVITRRQGVTATSQVVFSRAGTTGTITISVGSQVKASAGTAGEALVYTTTSLGTILNGNQDSNAVNISAVDIGTKYNVSPATITAFVGKPSGVDTVSNAASITNGEDLEKDDVFRNRIKLHILGLARCHPYGLESAAYGITDPATGKVCLFSKCVEDISNPGFVKLYIDDGAGTAQHIVSVVSEASLIPSGGVALGGETDIYLQHKPVDDVSMYSLVINGGAVPVANYYFDYPSGHIKLKSSAYPAGLTVGHTVVMTYSYFDQLIGEVQKVIDGDPADRDNYPGYRAAGVQVQVKAPQTVAQTVTANITVLDGYNQTDVATSVKAYISSYINGLSVGGDVIRNELIERIMTVQGLYDCNVTFPANNVTIGDTQLARIALSAITVT